MSFLGFPSLIVGIILCTAGTSAHWFAGVHTVGLVLAIASGAWIILWLLVFLVGVWALGR